MAVTDLTVDRYKVVADYPGQMYKAGNVIETYESGTATVAGDEDYTLKVCLKDYPAIFKKLEWWQELKDDEVPQYVKHTQSGKVFKVAHWNKNEPRAYDVNMKFLNLAKCVPATEQEYNSQKGGDKC